MTESERLARARSIAARLPHVQVTLKQIGGGLPDSVTFGRARNLGQPVVAFAAEAFDDMADDAVIFELRRKWVL